MLSPPAAADRTMVVPRGITMLALLWSRGWAVPRLLVVTVWITGVAACEAAGEPDAVPQPTRSLQSLQQERAALFVRLDDERGYWTTPPGWQVSRLDRLLQEQARTRSEVAGYAARFTEVLRALERGDTPAEVEAQIDNSGGYLAARARLDDIDIEIDAFTRKFGPNHGLTVAAIQRRQPIQAHFDEVREKLRGVFTYQTLGVLSLAIIRGRVQCAAHRRRDYR